MLRIPTDFERASLIAKENDVRELEQLFELRFPDDYRAFLLQTNGGRPGDRDSFPVADGGSSVLHVLYSVRHPRRYYTLKKQRLMYENRIPRDLLPIGQDQDGNTLCLGIGNGNRGKVYFWDLADERGQPTYENVRSLADDFATFLDSLHSDQT